MGVKPKDVEIVSEVHRILQDRLEKEGQRPPYSIAVLHADTSRVSLQYAKPKTAKVVQEYIRGLCVFDAARFCFVVPKDISFCSVAPSLSSKSSSISLKRKADAMEASSGMSSSKPARLQQLLKVSPKDDRATQTTKQLLDKLSPELLQQLQSHVAKLGVVTVGSMCSGSNVTSVLVADLLQVLKTGKFHDAFACEFDKSKQGFLKYVAEWLGEDSHNIFGDINVMGGHSAHCVNNDNRNCAIPAAPLITTCGFSCKNFSRLYYNEKREQILHNMLEDGKGSSGNTCQCMLAYLKTHSPAFHIWENVPSILQYNQKNNLDYLLKALLKAGYVCATDMFLSSDYHLPQDRNRAYGICIHVDKSGLSREAACELAQEVVETVKSMAADKPASMKNFLLKSSDSYLQKQLVKLQATRSKYVHKEALRKNLVWHKDTKAMCKRYGMQYDSLRLPRKLAASPWLRALPQREQSAIAVHAHLDKEMTSIETSQGVGRMTRNVDIDTIKTITPKGRWVLLPPMVKQARVLTGLEKMRMQGFPETFIRDYLSSPAGKKVRDADRLFSELSGNAFSGPLIEAFIISVLAHPPTLRPSFMRR